MATYGVDPLDSYFYSSYNPYISRYPRAKRETGWKYKSYFSEYGDAEAFNNHQRAHLKSILSQINPKLTPRLRKANTKDVAVQVNPKRDASVQCSIGPRTLLTLKRNLRSRKPQPDAGSPGSSGSPKSPSYRYPRTIAVYSPIAYRSITSFLVEETNTEASTKAQSSDPPEATGKDDSNKAEEAREKSRQEGNTAKVTEPGKKAKPKQPAKSEEVQTTTEGSKGKARVRFQVR